MRNCQLVPYVMLQCFCSLAAFYLGPGQCDCVLNPVPTRAFVLWCLTGLPGAEERLVPASQFSPIADQMMQLILPWPSKNLRTLANMQLLCRGHSWTIIVFLFLLCLEGFCQILLTEKIPCYLDIAVTGNVFRGEVHDPKVGKMKSLYT